MTKPICRRCERKRLSWKPTGDERRGTTDEREFGVRELMRSGGARKRKRTAGNEKNMTEDAMSGMRVGDVATRTPRREIHRVLIESSGETKNARTPTRIKLKRRNLEPTYGSKVTGRNQARKRTIEAMKRLWIRDISSLNIRILAIARKGGSSADPILRMVEPRRYITIGSTKSNRREFSRGSCVLI
jgi:hypothetical protein